MEILILHPGALGDIILSLPAIRTLGEQFPGARITFAANTDFAPAVMKGYADRVLSLSALPLHRLYSQEAIPQEDERLWRFYDRIVSWTGSGAEQFARQFARFHPCTLVASWKPERAQSRHVASIFADSLRSWFPLQEALAPAPIALDASALQEGEAWMRQGGWRGDRPVFALHPGAGSAAKRWPLPGFLELGRRLKTLGDLLILEGPAERGLGADLAAALGHPVILALDLPLRSLAALLSMCHAFIGNDSGIAHLAAGVNTPCVVLFGPTLPEQWAPLGTQVTAIREAANCLACSRGSGETHSCMENISVQKVWQNIMRIGFCSGRAEAFPPPK